MKDIPGAEFANAGVSFLGLSGAAPVRPGPLGIAAGLFFGKQLGIFTSAWAAIRANLAEWPATPPGYSFTAGFTMSLCIGLLAFPTSAELQEATKVGVLCGIVRVGGRLRS